MVCQGVATSKTVHLMADVSAPAPTVLQALYLTFSASHQILLKSSCSDPRGLQNIYRTCKLTAAETIRHWIFPISIRTSFGDPFAKSLPSNGTLRDHVRPGQIRLSRGIWLVNACALLASLFLAWTTPNPRTRFACFCFFGKSWSPPVLMQGVAFVKSVITAWSSLRSTLGAGLATVESDDG